MMEKLEILFNYFSKSQFISQVVRSIFGVPCRVFLFLFSVLPCLGFVLLSHGFVFFNLLLSFHASAFSFHALVLSFVNLALSFYHIVLSLFQLGSVFHALVLSLLTWIGLFMLRFCLASVRINQMKGIHPFLCSIFASSYRNDIISSVIAERTTSFDSEKLQPGRLCTPNGPFLSLVVLAHVYGCILMNVLFTYR